MEGVSIRILEKEANRRGDLFGRLMADLFVALGYEYPRLNSPKPGRELDLEATHRLEPRRAIAECKATAQTIGGDDLNKFAGAIGVEHEDKRPVTGYFISLAGFKETALEQERQRQPRIVMLDGPQIVNELIKGRILIAKDRATELAGRCCSALAHLTLDPRAELLAHERGWIWAIYYSSGKARTHYTLIHSDGTLLARSIVDEVVASDRDCDGELEKLVCLNPSPAAGSDADPGVRVALEAYRQYLANECGYIELDGLPADGDVGSRRLRLENLFVAPHLDVPQLEDPDRPLTVKRQPVGEALARHPRLALLAAPGAGKSTLVKRLVVAYADPARRVQIADALPEQDWLPLFFRCRELRGLARGSFHDLLEALSHRELVRQHAAAFRAHVDRALLEGRVLLVVDGLDEISDAGDRAAFACTVRTALQAYPNIAAVVTSREASFRHVASHLAPVCTQVKVSAFDADDIRRLSVAWHREVLGDTEKVQADAKQLAATITKNDRIRSLAVNPLMLTTLLLVKRRLGSLPERRAVLYGKAIEVLLTTWNVEGYDPIPEEEAMPQLCYVASAMMLEGMQKVSRPRLATLLREARAALPTELGYVKETEDQFIKRIEERSSLVTMTGWDVEDGRLVEFFEFRHLTFQEFLTARAMVEGWHPNRQNSDTLVSVLEPHFNKDQWREVIPLSAVLSGRRAEELIQRLTHVVSRLLTDGATETNRTTLVAALGQSLADEAPCRPDIARAAIGALVSVGLRHSDRFLPMLVRSRHGAELVQEAERAFLDGRGHFFIVASTLEAVLRAQATGGTGGSGLNRPMQRFVEMLSLPEPISRCMGAMGCSALIPARLPTIFHEYATWFGGIHYSSMQSVGDAISALLFADTPAEQHSAGWALYKLGQARAWVPPSEPDVLGRLFGLYWQHRSSELRALFLLALIVQGLAPRDQGRCASVDGEAFEAVFQRFDEGLASNVLFVRYDTRLSTFERMAFLIVAWYRRSRSDADLVDKARRLLPRLNWTIDSNIRRVLSELLKQLGQEPGEREGCRGIDEQSMFWDPNSLD